MTQAPITQAEAVAAIPTAKDDPRDGRAWHYVAEYGRRNGGMLYAVHVRGRCSSFPASLKTTARLAASRNRFERLDLEGAAK